jgi:hypothetical protein
MTATPDVTEEMIPALRSYLQPVVNNRLTSGMASWLAEVRRLAKDLVFHLPVENI